MAGGPTTTQPITDQGGQTAPRILVAATWQDPVSKAVYVHQDLVQTQKPWEEETHVSPMSRTERFGDIESFVAYVERFGWTKPNAPLITWNSQGLQAIIDYASDSSDGTPWACKWLARYPFVPSPQWVQWMRLANGQPVAQRQAVEQLEDLAEDIVEPKGADLMGLLRSLRASVNAKADTELRPDGTSSVAFSKDTQVKSAGSVDIPSLITIAVPILKGHRGEDGKAILYRIQVRVRVSVDDQAHLTLRFSIPNTERILESVYEDRVKRAKDLLGVEYELLRAAD